MTTAYTAAPDALIAPTGVYAPQEDSQLLIDVMEKADLARGRRVADLCTGSGVVAIAAAEQRAAQVTAFDASPRAARCARVNALAAGVNVDVHLGSWARAAEYGEFDLILCNPPYVPHDPDATYAPIAADVGPSSAWDAGYHGRLVLDPLCEAVPNLLAPGGTFLLVQSEFAVPRQTLAALASVGLDAEVVSYPWIPFGPGMMSRAAWLEETGRLEPGRREEELVVIRAEKP